MTSFDRELVQAVRMRPKKAVLAMLRETQEGMEAMASTEAERTEAAGLLVLIELSEKISAVFEGHA